MSQSACHKRQRSLFQSATRDVRLHLTHITTELEYSAQRISAPLPPASTLDESTAASSHGDGFSPSCDVRCQYSSHLLTRKPRIPRSRGCVDALNWSPDTSAPARPHEMGDDDIHWIRQNYVLTNRDLVIFSSNLCEL